jgi:PKD repeat protein
LDNCPFVTNLDQKDSDNNKIGDACENQSDTLGLYITIPKLEGSAPLAVTFDAISKGNVQKISRNFDDGGQDEGQKVVHTFQLPGIYRVQAIAQGINQQVIAQVILKIGGIIEQQFALQPQINSVGSYNTSEFNLGISAIGNIDQTERTFNGQEKSTKSPTQTFQKILSATGTYQVAIKGYMNQVLESAAIFNLGIASP